MTTVSVTVDIDLDDIDIDDLKEELSRRNYAFTTVDEDAVVELVGVVETAMCMGDREKLDQAVNEYFKQVHDLEVERI